MFAEDAQRDLVRELVRVRVTLDLVTLNTMHVLCNTLFATV